MSNSPRSSVNHFQETTVRGAPFRYVDLGRGTPVVFVHGAICDHRVWLAQLQALAMRARCIAYDQRYFGIIDWPKDGPQYSVATHADDLAGFVEEVVKCPAHIVGHSYGGGVALAMAVATPDWVKSLCLYEPAGMPSAIIDPKHLSSIANEQRGMAPVADAAAQEKLSAVKQAAEWLEKIPGCFNSLPRELQQTILENAHTLKQHFSAAPSKVTCADLHAVSAPVTLMWGADTRPYFAVYANAIRQCLADVEVVVLSGARHFAPFRDSYLFTRQVRAHLKRCGALAT
jgi:pimeloyl-ACP methyl ester carboxylesterase